MTQASGSADAERARELNEQGARYYQQGKLTAAFDAFSQAIAASPHPLAAFYFNRGRVRDDQGDLAGAIADYTESIRRDPQHVWSYRRRGLAHVEQGDLEAAQQDFSADLALQLNIYSYTERGYVRLRQGDLEGAFTDFNVALAITKDNPENYRAKAYAGRAQVAFERREDERALADLNEAIRLDPTDAECYFARSQVYLRRRDADRAIVDLNEALRLQPSFAQAYAERGFGRREKGDLAQALADFNRAIRINPRNARFYESRGVTYGMQGDFAKATTDFQMVLQLDPHYPHADDILAWLAQHGVQQRPRRKLW